MSKVWKTILITTACLVLVAAILVGVLWYFAGKTDPVGVSPVSNHMLYIYGEDAESSGYVSAEGLQSVYLSDTQTVMDIYVSEGQYVERGAVLFRYDTTLTDIQLTRKKLEVQQAELALKNAKAELEAIKKMKPYTPPPVTRPTTAPTTAPLEPVEEMPYFICGDGSWNEPYRFLWQDELSFDEAFLMELVEEEGTFYVAFEIREEDALAGELYSIWGLQVTATLIETEEETQDPTENKRDPAEEPTEPTESTTEEEEKFYALSYRFFAPSEIEHVIRPTVATTKPTEWIDTSSGYTSAEIARMKQEKELEIRDLDLAHRLLQVEYEKMKKESDSGFVYADINGTIKNLLTPEVALSEGQPLMSVSQGGTHYVTITLGEYDLDSYPIGTMATIISWENYGYEATGVLTSISDQPTEGYYNGSGNPDVTMYEAVIVLQADALVREGEWVSVRFEKNDTTASASFYLENAYIREENGRAYVYKRGADGLLVKTYVRTGASQWGYTAIIEGLTEEDWIAFPYGNDVKNGAKTYEDAEAYIDYAY